VKFCENHLEILESEMITLGSTVRDTQTGFEGIAVAYTQWMYGCNRYAVEPGLDEKGRPQEPVWLDEQRVELVENAATRAYAQTGGPPIHGDPRR
jgi:hypothetical protein